MPTFYDRFVECAERWPQNTALEIQLPDGIEGHTYAELRSMAESIAAWLVAQGSSARSAGCDSGRQSSALGRGIFGNHRRRRRGGPAGYGVSRRSGCKAAARQRRVSAVLRLEAFGNGAGSRRPDLNVAVGADGIRAFTPEDNRGGCPHAGSDELDSILAQPARELSPRAPCA